MSGSKPTRRAFLGGAAVALALPYLESLAPGARWLGRVHAQGMAEAPKRFLAYYVPNGMVMNAWTPSAEGAGYALSPILTPLAALQDQFLVLSGLANAPARPDGPGDHASGTGAFLTCAHPFKTEGAGISNGISADQVIANAIGGETLFPSLQLGIDGGASAGGCDSGYSCAYARNISWANETTPLAKLTNPRTVFDRLFAGHDPNASAEDVARRRRLKASVLDHVLAEANALSGRVGRSDKLKLDEYMNGIRELETRLEAGEVSCEPGPRPDSDYDYQEHVELMSELMVLAFQCDLSRVASFMLGNAGSNRSYPFIGVSGAHHEISHHQGAAQNLADLETIDVWEVQQLAYLLTRMAGIDEGGSSMLDNSIVFFSSEIEDGDTHSHFNMPIVVAGGGGGLRSGRHVRYTNDRPVSDLMLGLMGLMDVDESGFGDSTGPLTDLT